MRIWHVPILFVLLMASGCIASNDKYKYKCATLRELDRKIDYSIRQYPAEKTITGKCHLSGYVLDTDEHPIPGALIAIKCRGQKQLYGTCSDINGYFEFKELAETADCTVFIEAASCKYKIIRHISLAAATPQSLNVTLEYSNDIVVY